MIVTLSGSVRFEKEFIRAQRELTLRGLLFFSLAVLPSNRGPEEDWSDESYEKIIADLTYYERIARSDALLVLGDGYIGLSTAREILWAGIRGIPMYRHAPDDDWEVTANRIKGRFGAVTEILLRQAREYFTNPEGRVPKNVDDIRPDNDGRLCLQNGFSVGNGLIRAGDRVELMRYAGIKPGTTDALYVATGIFGTVSGVFHDGEAEVVWEHPTHEGNLLKWRFLRPAPLK